MTDVDALLKAILADPGDDTVRLVYADAIEETEPERAEFIRLQIDIEKLFLDEVEPGHLSMSGAYMGRHGKWFAVYKKEAFDLWTARIDELTGGKRPPFYPMVEPTFTRGFVSEVRCAWADWLTWADIILASHPIQKVKLTIGGGLRWNMMVSNGDSGTHPYWPSIEFELPPEFDAWREQAVIPRQTTARAASRDLVD